MLEKMSDFFENRLDGYEEHMMTDIESADEFYSFTARQLPVIPYCRILDLGCGTGLELEKYYLLNPSAKVTGIDLSSGMLSALKKKFSDKDISVIVGSYFEVPFGVSQFDGAVSVESLHHFTKNEKISLYIRLCEALKEGGYFILTDYFAFFHNDEYYFRELNVMDLVVELSSDIDNLKNYYVYDDGIIKGVAAVVGNMLDKLYVEPQFQRMGIGAELLDFAVHIKGVEELWALEYNKRGIAFYQRNGFELTDEKMIEDEWVPLLKMKRIKN